MDAEHFACTNAEYHDSPGISNSMVSVAKKNIEKFKGRFVDKVLPGKATDAMEFGEACHKMILGGGVVTEIPKEVLAKKGGELSVDGARNGNAWDAYKEKHAGESLLKAKQMKQLRGMEIALRANPAASRYLVAGGAKREYPIRWEDPETGLLLRCKPDILTAIAIPDLKTAVSCEAEEFAKAIIRCGYHRQDVFYAMGVKALTGKKLPMVFLVQEKEPPYTVELYDLDDEFQELGAIEIRATLDKILEASVENRYRSRTHGQITTLSPPRWAAYAKEWETEE